MLCKKIHEWFSSSDILRLFEYHKQATEENWSHLIQTRSDYQALLDGCWFSWDRAHHVVEFIERFLKLTDGPWKGKPFRLLQWQKDLLHALFGWVRSDGTRRFRRATIFVSKKVGKTWLSAAIAIYVLVSGADASPECYMAAVDSDQAGICFDATEKLVTASPGLRKRLDVVRSTKTITFPAKYGRVQAVSADSGKSDGINASLVIADEIHLWKNRTLYDVLRWSGQARLEPLFIIISTAGVQGENLGWEEYRLACDIRDGVLVDTNLLPVIYEATEQDDLGSEDTWRKACPSLGETVPVSAYRDAYAEAVTSPQRLANFKRRLLGIWVGLSHERFILPDAWSACRGEFPSDLLSLPCYMGLDLGNTDDASALVLVWKGESKIYVRPYIWCPEETIEQRAHEGRYPWLEWVKGGYLLTTPGAVTDYQIIKTKILELAKEVDLQELAYDRHLASMLVNELITEGLPCVFIPQQLMSLSGPTRELERFIKNRALVHDGNPVLAWMASNCVTWADANNNIRLVKNRSADKIDGVSALVNALARLIVAPEETAPYRGVGFAVI